MATINGNALTEKGMVKAPVRKAIVEKEINALLDNDLKGYDRIEEKAILVKSYVDINGNTIYATLTLTVSTNDPTAEKPKKTKAKKDKAVETYEIEEED